MRDDNGELPTMVIETESAPLLIEATLNYPRYRLVYADRIAAVFLEQPAADRRNLLPADATALELNRAR